MTDTLDTASTREIPRPSPGRPILLSSLRVFVAVTVVLAVVAGAYVGYRLHAVKVQERNHLEAEIRGDRAALIAHAAGHTIYAPTGWGADEFPRLMDRSVASWGMYGPVHLYLYQASARDIPAASSHLRHANSWATPESLCRFSAADRQHYRLLGVEMKTIRCSPVPGSHALIRIIPDYPQSGDADVRLSFALPEKGRYLNLWAIDETGTIAQEPAGWATAFIKDLQRYDITDYSVEDIYQSGAYME